MSNKLLHIIHATQIERWILWTKSKLENHNFRHLEWMSRENGDDWIYICIYICFPVLPSKKENMQSVIGCMVDSGATPHRAYRRTLVSNAGKEFSKHRSRMDNINLIRQHRLCFFCAFFGSDNCQDHMSMCYVISIKPGLHIYKLVEIFRYIFPFKHDLEFECCK